MVTQSAKLVMAVLVALAAAATSATAQAPSISGLWQKIDDSTGNSVGWFLFVQDPDGSYQGVIAKLFLRPGDPPNQTCSSCRDDRRDAPILGLPLIRQMRQNGLYYEGGNILDPRDGNIYNATMRLSPDSQTLTVRGYLGIELFGRDETWHRLPDNAVKELDPIIVTRYLPAQAPALSAMRRRENTARSGYTVR